MLGYVYTDNIYRDFDRLVLSHLTTIPDTTLGDRSNPKYALKTIASLYIHRLISTLCKMLIWLCCKFIMQYSIFCTMEPY